MAEAIGAANGVASLFNTTLAWFEYVYIAKETGSRLQSLILQLDNAQLRLSRWGEAAGLSGTHVEDEESASDSLVLNGEQKKVAISTFNFICSRFEKCEKICHAFRNGKTENDPKVKELETPLSRARWSPANKYLHETMRRIVEGRKNKIGVLRRAKFAIYDENHLKELVKDINDHIDSLYKIFPLPDDTFSLDKQTQQTKHEMTELLSVMEMLGSTVQSRDKLLGSAIGVILNQKASA
ncbi:hypothetical protein CkaCkLH20_10366 [Colletotrichum karsti]|uniref:Prion-inhibition and propagation HeLo domain-containing protein n=1 Tax=Colletotrichum karsti TaxID=1095194 RepID=A0A9P6HWX6_9PEZI|nr:uncharacterized protein CkaCkLH20_10366 [Colletotrichum karsti]KAF9872029.1 hypothetical protein CkaCkLH20_10366 [Colletotrichum karsti]